MITRSTEKLKAYEFPNTGARVEGKCMSEAVPAVATDQDTLAFAIPVEIV